MLPALPFDRRTAHRDARRSPSCRKPMRRNLRGSPVLGLALAFGLTAQSGSHSSGLQTLPSSTFVPNGEKLYPLAVPGTREVHAGGRAIRIAEVRGWLRAVEPTCYAKDPAWYYLLEPDPAWMDSVGMSLADILRVGNITGLVDRPDERSIYENVGVPLIRIEFGGWDPRKRNGPPPGDWLYRGAAGCPSVSFAFDPLRPIPLGPRLKPGSYVRVVGSLVSDAPHATKATVGVWLVRNFGIALDSEFRRFAAQNIWSEGAEEDPNNPARWTEIHPPDEIEPLPDPKPSETVRGVAVCVHNGIFQKAEPLVLALSPPGQRPTWARGVHITEHVISMSPNVVFARSVSATRVTVDHDLVRIRIDPQSAGLAKFAAIYRVSWSPGGPVWTVVKRRASY